MKVVKQHKKDYGTGGGEEKRRIQEDTYERETIEMIELPDL
jgi:hypothetical protein